MTNQHHPPAMSQKIFSLNLSTETISVYLMCCGLTDAGATLSTPNMLEIWNGSEASLQEGLSALAERKILKKIISDQDSRDIYILTGIADWEEA
jgi:hypothetical protein